ncbi:hypothetical protein [Corallococcus exercitus]|uniref:hypothetical protein n=1 Tax=Corallococcus exercitus TaxID=2316736 RepID=UPI0035D52987
MDDDVPDTGSVIGEDTSPPEEPDTGNPPEEPDAGGPLEQEVPELPPEEPDPIPRPAECGYMPTVSPEALGAWDYEFDPAQLNALCGVPVSDGAGRGVMVRLYDQSINVWVIGKDHSTFMSLSFAASNFQPTSQSNGVLGFSTPLGGGMPWLTYLDTTNGQFTHHPPETAPVVRTAVDPTGGLRALLADGTLKAYSATGEVRWSVPVSMSALTRALGVDAQGRTLLLAAGTTRFGTSTVEGLWVDSSGQPGAPFLAMAPAPGPDAIYEFVPQAKQGLFLAIWEHGNKRWAAAFKSLRPASSTLPTWLARGAPDNLLRLPDGRGYLRVAQGCSLGAQFITASGMACGTFAFPGSSTECGPLSLDADGTVVEALPSSENHYHTPDGTESERICRIRWWPGLIQ